MAFDFSKAKEADFVKDTVDATSGTSAADKRKKLVKAVEDHVTKYLHEKDVLERKAKKDDDGEIVKDGDKTVYHMVPKQRVLRMSKPSKNDGKVVCQLKYGNKAHCKVKGKDSWEFDASMEEDFWQSVIEMIKDGSLDAEIDRASKEAAPTITK